jgi:hypothetical protein
MDYVMTIGLGKSKTIDSLRVIWPDDSTQKLSNIEANQLLTFNQTDAKEKYILIKNENKTTLLKELDNSTFIAHKENNYSDFDYEGLISKMLSQEGPAMSVADFNGDGNEDIFIGGANNQAGTIYLNYGNGNLKITTQKDLESDAIFEDTASALFDVDGDGDIDLMVGTGGNQIGEEKTYKTRLYLNNGKGVFIKTDQDLPSTFNNISVISPYDFDNDGDIDVFIGSRSVVGTYGINAKHLFLENKGDGTFSDSTERLAYDLKNAGMVTNAIWADFDDDGKKDLITVSEWGTPIIYKNSGRSLTKFSNDLDNLFGWWNVIEAADLDNDGDMDFVIGNQGSNTSYKTSQENPMKMWVNDYDNNGTIEQIVTQNFNGRDFPIHMKKELTTQIVSLKKRNLKASEYAKKSIDELYAAEIMQNTIMKKTTIAESVIAINEGKGNFTTKKLPYMVQLSCVCGITCTDINNDGFIDIIMGGNNFEFKPQYSRLDANYGSVLLGDGKLGFEWQNYDRSGFFIKNEIKHIKQFKDKNGKTYIITAINNDKPKIFTFNE